MIMSGKGDYQLGKNEEIIPYNFIIVSGIMLSFIKFLKIKKILMIKIIIISKLYRTNS
jgi:hypothetical protein